MPTATVKVNSVIAKAIKKANENFKKMTKPQKRVAIAKDVLLQINNGKYWARKNVYVQLNDPLPLDSDVELIQIFSNPTLPTCDVCARGAMFVSACRTMDKCTVGDINGENDDMIRDYQIQKYESKFFSSSQISLIESSFERFSMGIYADNWKKGENGVCVYYGPVKRAIEFGEKYGSNKDRMVAIMKNIIKNDGTFKP